MTTTARNLWLGFGTLTALLVLSSVAIIVRVWSIEGQVGELAIASNRNAVASELEINVLGYALNVRAYLQGDEPKARQNAVDEAAKVERRLTEYERLAMTDQQREVATRLATSWQELKKFGQSLLDAENRRLKPEESTRFYDLRTALENLLHEEMRADAIDTYNARRDTVLRDVRSVVGFVLILLVVGAFIAVVTSGAVARGIVNGERQLWASRERFRVTLASIGDAVIATDTQGRVAFLNGVAESLTGWKNDDAAGVPLEQVFRIANESTRESVENPATRAMREGVIVGLANHTVLFAKDGTEVPIDDSAASIQDEQGKVAGVVLIFRDVTERRRADNQLRKLAADLSESDRRKNEFLATLAHELRNPLAPIRNSLQIMRLTGGDREAAQSASEMMERQVGQMVRLVDDLVDVSRISRGKVELRKEPVELASAVNQAVEAAGPLCESMNHELSVTLAQQSMYVNADPTRLAQVIGNLLSNACKFTPRGGRISLTVEREGKQAVIRVQDNGIGIAAHDLPRIFDMFTQVDTSLERSISGLGIGLALVKNIMEMHDGTVEAHSAGVGHGSEFVVRLPVMVETPEPSLPEPAVSEPTTALRILVVDDNRDSATSLAMLLKMTGNNTQIAYDGAEAVEAAETFRPDVVLLDIGLPKLNGFEAARKIREQLWGENTVLVALTGWGQEEDLRKSKDAGFDSHMVKPVDYAALMKLLAELQPAGRVVIPTQAEESRPV